MSEDELKKCWQKAIATWETAVQSLQESSNRSVQAQIRERFFAFPFWPDDEIVITGEAGAGKTVLAKSMLRQIDPTSPDALPGKSRRAEGYRCVLRGEVSHGRRRRKVQLTVIPGQPSEPRKIAEHEEFGTSPPATTVIHAVCWGRNRVWEPENRNIMLETLRESNGNPVNLEQIFAETRKNELDNFRRFSDDVLTKSWRNQEGLTLIVAVTMSDLFKDRLDEVRDYYIPTSAENRRKIAQATAERTQRDTRHPATDSSIYEVPGQWAAERAPETTADDSEQETFAQELSRFVGTLGVSRFRHVAILPVSTVPVDQKEIGFKGVVERSQMSKVEIDLLLSHFVAKVREYSAADRRG